MLLFTIDPFLTHKAQPTPSQNNLFEENGLTLALTPAPRLVAAKAAWILCRSPEFRISSSQDRAFMNALLGVVTDTEPVTSSGTEEAMKVIVNLAAPNPKPALIVEGHRKSRRTQPST